MEVFPVGAKKIKDGQLFFTVAGLPYVFAFTPPNLSFWQFLSASHLQIFVALLLCMVGIIVGCGGGIALSQKKLIKYRSLTKKQKLKLHRFEGEKRELAHQLDASKKLSTLKERSQQKIQLLLCCLHANYRETAACAQAINKMTSNLTLDKVGYDEHMNQIHQMSQDSSIILNRLVNGFPTRVADEKVDIVQCLENIKMIFLPQLTEMSIQFEMKGKIQSPISLDKTLFEIVLHNIFQIIIDRFIENNTFKIDLRDNSSIEILFRDDGYDIKNRICSANHNLDIDNILFLGKTQLQDLINGLGWIITFQGDGESLNTIVLSIPKSLKNHSVDQKVISILDFKPHVK